MKSKAKKSQTVRAQEFILAHPLMSKAEAAVTSRISGRTIARRALIGAGKLYPLPWGLSPGEVWRTPRQLAETRQRCSTRRTADGRGRIASAKYNATHRKERRNYKLVYNTSARGTASALRTDHGFNHEDSITMAKQLRDPEQRCACCGVANHVLARYTGRMPGRRLGARGLQVDHVLAGGQSTL